jgi:hypothetical protein
VAGKQTDEGGPGAAPPGPMRYHEPKTDEPKSDEPRRDAAEPDFAAENAPSPTDPANVAEAQSGGDENPQPPTRA